MPFKLSPQRISQEISDWNQDLLQGLSTLNGIEEIDVGTAEADIIYQEDRLSLKRYTPTARTKANAKPLLIVYALVNRPYILDLQPDRSLIRGLLQEGIPVYLIDWGYPQPVDQFIDLHDYLCGYLDRCVDAVRADSNCDNVDLLGVCQGGVFSLCYTALHPDKVNNLITLVTPINFHTENNVLAHLARTIDIDLVIRSHGNMPGQLLIDAFRSLMPMNLTVRKQLNLPNQLRTRDQALNYMRMEKWVNDCPDLAGAAFSQFMALFFQQNALLGGKFQLGNQEVDLGSISQPILNIYGSKDHLVPPQASQALKGLTSSRKYEEMEIDAGHIGLFAGSRSQALLPQKIGNWVAA